MARPRITHVIFDLDGTLLDTEPMYAEATDLIFGRFGLALAPEVRGRMTGLPTPEAVALMLRETPLPMTALDFIHERDVLLHERFPRALPTRGAQALTAHLAAHGVPQAIATSSTNASLAAKRLGHPEWFAGFAAIVTSEDVERGKPAPDIFLEAARRMGAKPSACLVFEDSPAGVAAGLAAGMSVVALPEPALGRVLADAHAAIAHLEAFDPGEWGLPGYIRSSTG